ncbi:hypothetical protein D3C84_659890 [compost metagenome]
MFHADFGGVLHLVDAAAEHFAQGAGGHRAGHADFALAADLGAGDRGVFLVEDADGGGGEQEAHHAVVVGAGDEAHVVVQHRRHYAGRAVGRGGHHAAAAGVFLVDRQGVEVDPVEHAQRVAQGGFRMVAQLAVQGGGAALDLEPAGHDAFVAAAGGDAVLHHLPDLQQTGAGFRFRAPGGFVGQHHLADRQLVFGAVGEQLLAGGEGVGQYGLVLDDAVGAGGVFIDHETAAHRVVLARADLQAGCVEGAEDHAVGVILQRFADHRQVFFLDEADRFFAEQSQFAGFAQGRQASGDTGNLDGIRLLALEAEQHRLVAAVALAGGAERAVQLDFDRLGADQQAVAAQTFGEAGGGAHRPDRVRAGRADADFE